MKFCNLLMLAMTTLLGGCGNLLSKSILNISNETNSSINIQVDALDYRRELTILPNGRENIFVNIKGDTSIYVIYNKNGNQIRNDLGYFGKPSITYCKIIINEKEDEINCKYIL